MRGIEFLFRRSNWPAWVVLAASLVLVALAGSSVRREVSHSAGQAFDMQAVDLLHAIELRLQQYQQLLLGAAALFNASDNVTRQEWRAYIEGLRLGQDFAGMQGIGFSLLIPPPQLEAHTAAVRAEGFADYSVHPKQPPRALYSSIVFLEPFSGRNLTAFGYDMMSEPVRARAMQQAVERNLTTISGKVRLLQETHGKVQPGFLMYVPVYHKNQPLDTAEQRRSALYGFVYSPFRMNNLMADILGQRKPGLHFSIFDGESENFNDLMFSSRGHVNSPGQPAAFTRLRSLNVYGHTWTVRLDSPPEFERQTASPLPLIIFTLGGGISLLLFALVSFQLQRREQAARIAARMTADIRASERQLRQSEARLLAILDNVAESIITINDEGEIQSVNAAAARMFGYQAADLLSQSVSVLIPELEYRPAEHHVQTFRANGGTAIVGQRLQVTALHRDGARIALELGTSEIWLNGRRLLICIMRDVRERLWIERMRAEFISTVGHALFAPLTSIHHSLAMIAEGVRWKLPPSALEVVRIAHNGSEQLMVLVNEILDLEKLEAGKVMFEPRPTPLGPIVEQALDEARPYAASLGVDFEYRCEVPEAMLQVDGNRLRQALNYLLSNAAKFSSSDPIVTVRILRAGSSIRVEVQNRGNGNESELRPFIFDKFSQQYIADMRQAGGISFGLCIAKLIVEQMDGKLDFTSESRALTTFYLEFPEHA